jgi:hypothetical protein
MLLQNLDSLLPKGGVAVRSNQEGYTAAVNLFLDDRSLISKIGLLSPTGTLQPKINP